MILENDTERKSVQEILVRFRMSKTLMKREEVTCFGERAMEKRVREIRIKHQSLILAQDERWRRA